jgi:hypothetical protein
VKCRVVRKKKNTGDRVPMKEPHRTCIFVGLRKTKGTKTPVLCPFVSEPFFRDGRKGVKGPHPGRNPTEKKRSNLLDVFVFTWFPYGFAPLSSDRL